MPEGVTRKRFVESVPGRLAGVLLGVLWIASASAVDAHAYSYLPYVLGLAFVVLLVFGACVTGKKLVQLPLIAWVSLLMGGYFYARCNESYAMIESWRESALIVACAVFYIAGVYAGQVRRNRALVFVLSAALLVHLAAFVVMRHPDSEMIWLGRPAMSLSGPNTPYITLFLYKNFAALFLSAGGAVLMWRALWQGRWSAGSVATCMLGAASVGVSFLCGARIVWLVLPFAAAVGWVLWLVLRLYAKRRIGVWTVLMGVGLVACAGIGLYDLFFGELMARVLSGVDSHLRHMIWSHLCEVIPNAPSWGLGTGASQWEIVPTFHEWYTPNYAHNEYLQVWVDYGVIGVVLMLCVLVAHLVAGFLSMASESVDNARRTKLAMAWLMLVLLLVAAATDFVWHDAALATLTAFCCGILVSPRPCAAFSFRTLWRRWAEGSGPRVQPVRAQGRFGCVLLSIVGACILLGAWQLWQRTARAWVAQWQYDAMVRRGATPDARRVFLVEVMQHYPDSAIMDHYVRLPYQQVPDWAQVESLLWLAHRANPKQLFTVVMLADVLGRQGKCEDAEKLLRRCYVGDGMDAISLTAWPSYYSANLLQWAQQMMSAGQVGKARSMFNYAFKVGGFMPSTAHRGGAKNWTEGGSRQRRAFVEACRADAATLNAMQVPEDDSWQLPLEPGGKPSLYRRRALPVP